jgi:hypothetical protein
MKLKTELDIPASKNPIELEDKVVLLGSCFTDNIGEKLSSNKFNVSINPLGISFNPLSLHNQLKRILANKLIEKDELIEKDGIYYHWDFHSDFCNTNKNKMLEEINSKISESYEFYKNSKHLIITYGTSYFYRNLNTNRVVNNCHQFPNHIFEKQIGNTKLFSDSFLDVYNTLIIQNPEINITLTLSPIKHYRDGIIENNLSKSVLTCFIHAVIAAAKNTEYFPSYEIVNDELRDYRFYKENLTHPNDLAIEIIWEKFLETKIGENSKEFIRSYQTLVKLKTHRIRQLGTIAHQQFIDKGLEKINLLSKKYPAINFTSELEYFRSM